MDAWKAFWRKNNVNASRQRHPHKGRGPVCFTVVSPAPTTGPDVHGRYLINVRDRKKSKGGKEEKKKDRKKAGKIMTKPKTEMTRSYLQVGEVR